MFRFQSLPLALCLAPLLTGCVINAKFLPDYDDLSPATLQKADGLFTSNKIVMIDCAGIVSGETDSGFGRPSMLLHVTDVLAEIEDDPSVKAVMLRIDSPGGGVTASDQIYRELAEFKKRRDENEMPVVITAAMMDLAASGGYYIALAADEIYAHPTTVTGSIGVIAMFPQVTGLTEKVGVDMRVVKSGANKDMGSLFREMSAEERALWQGLIDEMYDRFVSLAVESRGIDEAAMRKLADGRVYTAKQALAAKLIDRVTYLEEMIDRTKELADIEDARVVMYRYDDKSEASLYAGAGVPPIRADRPAPTRDAGDTIGTQINLLRLDGSLPDALTPRFEYRYYR